MNRPAPIVSALLFCVGALCLDPSTAAAEADIVWSLVKGRVAIETHAWTAECGPSPTTETVEGGAWRLDQSRALVPIDDARSLFGPGICRSLLGNGVTDEQRADGDIRCVAGGQVAGRLAMRTAGVGRLAITHQLRLEPKAGCHATAIGTFLLAREGAPPPASRVAGLAGLEPTGALPRTPDLTPVPARRQIAADAQALPTPPAGPGHLVLWFFAGSLVVFGIAGIWTRRRG